MTTSEKIKVINKKIKQNKAQYDLDRQTAKISTLSSGNVGKFEFLTGKEVLPEKRPSEKAATVKRFEYSPLGNKLKKQTGIAEKTVLRIRQGRKYNKSDLTYNGKHSFYKYYDVKKIGKLFFKSKYSFLVDLFNHLDKFSRLRTKEKTTGKK